MTETDRRIEAARDRLVAAETLVENGYRPDAVSRAYYGVFEAARALLLIEDVETTTHAGGGNRLGFHYRGDIDTRTFTRLRQEREGCDYELSVPSEKRVQECLRQARTFVAKAASIAEAG